MPYCPKCREEFRPDFTICEDCSVALVDTLESEEVEIEELDVVCTTLQEENAYILRGYLESEGIPCQLENMSFHAAPAGDLTKVRLWTKKSDVKQARQLIEEHEQFNYCSNCGHVAQPQDTGCDFCGEKFEN